MNDKVITLGDIATVRRTFKDRVSYSHANGEQSISLFVYRRPEAFLIGTAHEVEAFVADIQDEIPTSIGMFISSNYASFAERLVNELQGNMVTALVLVMIVVLATMGFRSSVLVGTAIPIAFLFALIILWIAGQSFNFMVMFGMLLGLGMLIDGVVVVAEDADRRMADGVGSAQAYSSATVRMARPCYCLNFHYVSGVSTPTLLARYCWRFPMGYLPRTVFLVMVGALLYALVFAPAFGNFLMGDKSWETRRERSL